MGWFRELMLESVSPPGVYLPTHRIKLEIARLALRGNANPRTLVKSARLRDFTLAHGYGMPRTVPKDEVAAEVEEDFRTVNPPVVQGWIVAIVVLSVLWVIVSLTWLDGWGLPTLLADGLVVGPPVALFGLIVLAALEKRTVELRDGRVLVHGWLDRWTRGRPTDLGEARAVVARVDGDALVLSSEEGSVRIPMVGWPPSARRDAADELPIWGIQGLTDRTPSRRAERDRRREQAIQHARERQEQRRR